MFRSSNRVRAVTTWRNSMNRALAINALKYTLIAAGVFLIVYGIVTRMYLMALAGAFVVWRSSSAGT